MTEPGMSDTNRAERRYCLCGAGMQVMGTPATVLDLVAKFEEFHSGEGHGPATARQAGAARLREEHQRLADLRGSV